jgi:hypothetical protein
MSLALQEILTLVGRLDDAPGYDAPRERFRRFLTEHVTDVRGIRSLLAECQQAFGDQHARARHDLIVMLGVFLGFEVSFGAYETPSGLIQPGGHWRSRHRARIVIDVRSERSASTGVDELAQLLTNLSAATPADLEEPWFALCVTTPFYATRRDLEALLAQRPSGDIHCISLESLLWLAETAAADRVTHDDVLRLLASGTNSDFTVDLMRRVAESATPTTSDRGSEHAELEREPSESDGYDRQPRARESGHLSIVEREFEPDYWLASLASDEAASPKQMLEYVIRERHVLGISDSGPFPMPVHGGDWVCFYIARTGVAGHAQFDSVIADPSAVIRDAGRFTAVFQLKNVTIYESPNRVSLDAIGLQAPSPKPYNNGAVLAPISRHDFEALTINPHGHTRGRGIKE